MLCRGKKRVFLSLVKLQRFLVGAAVLALACVQFAAAQPYTHADSLKGNYGPARNWWNVLHYDLHVTFNPDTSLQGYNVMTFKALRSGQRLQLDLLRPMQLDSVLWQNTALPFVRDEDAYFVNLPAALAAGNTSSLRLVFHGRPKLAVNAPWDGGLVWSADKNGNPWISVACQGMAARVWFPNKDHMADEPDSVDLHFRMPNSLVAVSNGRLQKIEPSGNYLHYNWRVKSPINNYNIIPYVGKYVNIKDTFAGKSGVLDLSYWVLQYNYNRAVQHFTQVKSMLRCFEEWFGPYPFYADGYKLVEAPYLGMEHQSAIAYGNDYNVGYKGRDLSQTGWGLKWDFIIVHESGHEWFGNNISAADVADNWIHESFTAYAENLYVEYLFGKKAGAEYVIGTRAAILNDKPMVADYNVNRIGSGDVYYKGANMLHTLRQWVNNDSVWKACLRGLNTTFWHQTVNSKQIEMYLSSTLKLNLQAFFDHYLRTKQLPVLEYKLKGNTLVYRWTNCKKSFNMPVDVMADGQNTRLFPGTKWKKLPLKSNAPVFDANYYVVFKQISGD